MPRILLTFVGFHDPYSRGLIGDEEQPGPILSLAGARSFDEIVLISTPNTTAHTEATAAAVPAPVVRTIHLPLQDPTDYSAILTALRREVLPSVSEAEDAEIFVAVASGTPQMHACWLLLVASGELPARILHVRPPKFVTKDRPLVADVDLSAPEFPEVRYSVHREDLPPIPETDPQTAAAILGLVGDHPKLRSVIDAAAAIAPAAAPVLIHGETGTGKELIARALHFTGKMSDKPFVAVNCGAIPRDLMESELFGFEKGAFTGANARRIGKIEEASGGSLFLDEIGELDIALQVKLLRVLQESELERLGSNKKIKVNFRLISSSNRNLGSMVDQGHFREDLYYRLNVIQIHMPPLRDRVEDIPLLVAEFLRTFCARENKTLRVSDEVMHVFQNYPWPGNVRQLKNAVERAVVLARGDSITLRDLPEELKSAEQRHDIERSKTLRSLEATAVVNVLQDCGGNKSRAAKILGISRKALYKRLTEYNIG